MKGLHGVSWFAAVDWFITWSPCSLFGRNVLIPTSPLWAAARLWRQKRKKSLSFVLQTGLCVADLSEVVQSSPPPLCGQLWPPRRYCIAENVRPDVVWTHLCGTVWHPVVNIEEGSAPPDTWVHTWEEACDVGSQMTRLYLTQEPPPRTPKGGADSISYHFIALFPVELWLCTSQTAGRQIPTALPRILGSLLALNYLPTAPLRPCVWVTDNLPRVLLRVKHLFDVPGSACSSRSLARSPLAHKVVLILPVNQPTGLPAQRQTWPPRSTGCGRWGCRLEQTSTWTCTVNS